MLEHHLISDRLIFSRWVAIGLDGIPVSAGGTKDSGEIYLKEEKTLVGVRAMEEPMKQVV